MMAKKENNLEASQNFTFFFIRIITNFLAIFCCYFSIFPSWIRIHSLGYHTQHAEAVSRTTMWRENMSENPPAQLSGF